MTPISTATNTAGKPIKVGTDPGAIAITPNGKTAYVANDGSGTVTPIDTATNTAGKPIKVGTDARRHRDHAEREDRLRRQRPLGHGDPDPHRHQHGRQGDQGRERPRRHRDHAEREDRLRRQRRLGHGDPDPDRHQYRRQGRSRSGASPAPSRSRRNDQAAGAALDCGRPRPPRNTCAHGAARSQQAIPGVLFARRTAPAGRRRGGTEGRRLRPRHTGHPQPGSWLCVSGSCRGAAVDIAPFRGRPRARAVWLPHRSG